MTKIVGWGTVILFMLLILVMVASRGEAAIQCGPHKRVTETLASRYGEAPTAIGTVSAMRFMEVYVSQAGSWTILVTTLQGVSCIVAAGQDWEDVPHTPLTPGKDL